MTADPAAIGGHQRWRVQQSIFQTLMIALSVIVLNVFAYAAAQRRLPNKDHSI